MVSAPAGPSKVPGALADAPSWLPLLGAWLPGPLPTSATDDLAVTVSSVAAAVPDARGPDLLARVKPSRPHRPCTLVGRSSTGYSASGEPGGGCRGGDVAEKVKLQPPGSKQG